MLFLEEEVKMRNNFNHLNEIEGLTFIPLDAKKVPQVKEWQAHRKKYDLSNVEGVGLVCGIPSGNVEVLDIDAKYDLTGTLFEDLKNAIHAQDKNLLKKMVLQSTMSGGYHLIYRCSVIEGNKKLANRPTTEEEKDKAYKSSYENHKAKGKPEKVKEEDYEDYLCDLANKARQNDKIRVLLETRGDRGQVACHPMKGYSLIYGDFTKIQEITPDERNMLFTICYTFNQVFKEPEHDRKIERKKYKGLSPSEHYDQEGDVQALLIKHGWERVGRKGGKILFKRPGDTKAEHSGNFDEDKNWFSVFSTSTQFNEMTPYLPYAVYAVLECNGDFNQVPLKLKAEGWGDEELVKEDLIKEVPTQVDLTQSADIYLAKPEDYKQYLRKWRDGTFEKGKGIGVEDFDKHFVFKEGNMVCVNGIDNVGKTTTIWYLAALSNLFHGWKWLIFSSENKIGSVYRKLIEFYWCELIEEMSDEKYRQAEQWAMNNFDVIKTGDTLYNYQSILDIVKLCKQKKKYHGFLLDPYNSLKVDLQKNIKVYDYHYEAASKIKLFCANENISTYINMHANTAAARSKDAEGFTKPPQKEDSEMGVMFANKTDEFLTVHRNTQGEKEFTYTELHIRKVKETETGGRVTPMFKPIFMRAHIGVVGFDIITDKLNNIGVNPVKIWREKQKEKSQGDIFKGSTPHEIDTNSYIVPNDTEDTGVSPF